jgi:hypothetical protein
VVVRSEPFQRTFEPETKPVPVTVSVKPTPPPVALEGNIELSVGTGFLFETVTVTELEGVQLPAASHAIAVSVCVPSLTAVVSHDTE